MYTFPNPFFKKKMTAATDFSDYNGFGVAGVGWVEGASMLGFACIEYLPVRFERKN